jgi:hypothetical protein
MEPRLTVLVRAISKTNSGGWYMVHSTWTGKCYAETLCLMTLPQSLSLSVSLNKSSPVSHEPLRQKPIYPWAFTHPNHFDPEDGHCLHIRNFSKDANTQGQNQHLSEPLHLQPVRIHLIGTVSCPKLNLKLNSMVWVHERTIPTERPPLVGEVIANFCG